MGQTSKQRLTVSSASGPALFSWQATGANVRIVSSPFTASDSAGPLSYPAAPGELEVEAGFSRQPGTYSGSVVISWNGGSVTVPLTINITATADYPPLLSAVVNAASGAPAALAPGEIISVLGLGIGGAPGVFTIDAKGNLPTNIEGEQLWINGKPAPLLYASAGQINAVVPHELASSGTASLQAVTNGLHSDIWEMTVAVSAPALFTLGAGVGQAAALNQDGSVNGASSPAAPGTILTLFGTGGGQNIPASVTGTVSGSADTTALPVSVTIGGIDAAVLYHGSAPGVVAGVLQLNAMIPQGIAAAVVVTVGGRRSQSGVTIAVR